MSVGVSVVGLGKLGACMAAAMASRGIRTIGVDVNSEPVERVRAKVAPVQEPGLAELLLGCNGLIGATTDFDLAIRETEITFVVVPTPSNPDGAFSLEYVCSAMRRIGVALRKKSGYHLIVLSSTVLPGSTEYVVLPLLEEVSSKRKGVDFGLCYSPEFIALGSVIRDFLNPDMLLIGESDVSSGDRLSNFYRAELKIDAPVARMTTVNAELTKIALNTYVTTKITFANLLSEVCERLPGGDVDVVTQALGLDRRIGGKYLKGGLGYGGPCFPRDNKALAHFLDILDVPSELPKTVDQMNRRHPERVFQLIKSLNLSRGTRVTVLGLAYKPNTNVVEESQGLAIAALLAKEGFAVVVYDPLAMEQARRILGSSVRYAESVSESLSGAKVVLIANDLPEFHEVLHQTSNQIPRPYILDAWRFLRPAHSFGPISYRSLGIGSTDRANTERVSRFVRSLGALGDEEPKGGKQSKAQSSSD